MNGHRAVTEALVAAMAEDLDIPAEFLTDGVGLSRRTLEPAIERARTATVVPDQIAQRVLDTFQTDDSTVTQEQALAVEQLLLTYATQCEQAQAVRELHRPRDPGPPKTEAELHATMSHPEWEYAITEGQRKAFDAGEPPDPYEHGTGWEVNREQGRDGWERFDFTEQAYWRRRRTEPLAPPSALCAECHKPHPCPTAATFSDTAHEPASQK